MTPQILLIDDDPVINFIHSRVVQSKFPDIAVVIFENGTTALEYIRNYPMNFYLIFLDLNMPVMNGWDFLDTVSTEEMGLNLQVHILSSSLDPSDKIKAKQNKLVLSYIPKPLRSIDLKDLKCP